MEYVETTMHFHPTISAHHATQSDVDANDEPDT